MGWSYLFLTFLSWPSSKGFTVFSRLNQLSNRRNVASLSLLCCYFHVKSSDVVHSLITPVIQLPVKTRYDIFISKSFLATLSIFLRILFERTKLHSDILSQERLLRGKDSQKYVFQTITNVNLSSRVNCYLSRTPS